MPSATQPAATPVQGRLSTDCSIPSLTNTRSLKHYHYTVPHIAPPCRLCAVQLLQSQQRPKGDSWERPDPDQPCFVECVTQVFTQDELQAALDEAGPDALVVVDFYKTACGACKYIQPG